MTVRLKLKATVVNSLGDEALAETVSAHSYQRTLSKDQKAAETGDLEVELLPDVGDLVGGQYRLVRRLGKGMFGSVFVAERTDVREHRVAMKIVNRLVYGERDVERELVMLAAATHPNIVELKDHGMTAEFVWLTMPLYEGETLAERLARGTLSLKEAFDIFRPIAQGIAALHTRGLRHQDIKPENIYLARFGEQIHPVLLDLGVAVEADSTFIAGTALYGAPEQLAALGGMGDTGVLSEAMDTYCMASTLLWSLVGEEHFPGSKARTPFHLVEAFETREETPLHPDALPELIERPRKLLIEAFQRWLVRDPEVRPAAAEMAHDLDVLLEQEREQERAEERRVRRQRTLLQRVSAALILLALVVAGFSYYGFTRRETLRLAAELQAARREARKAKTHFDDLKSCEAAHHVSESQLATCKTDRASDAREHKATFTALSHKNDELATNLTSHKTKLLTCEEDAETAKTAFDEEKAELISKQEEAQASWDEAKSALEAKHQTCVSESESLTTQITQCKQELASCEATGDDVYAQPGPKAPVPKTPVPKAVVPKAPPPATDDAPYD